MRNDRDNLIVKLTLEFALEVITYTEQLLKSGTSIGANIRESQNAESKADFIHKMKIAAKEVDETEYWLTLCELSPNYPNPSNLRDKLLTIHKILPKIISTSKS
jgi:four helix bundle protein